MRCMSTKTNIVSGKSTGHHQSIGFIYGFGARKETHIDVNTGSSVHQYVVLNNNHQINHLLEQKLTLSMQGVHQAVNHAIGYDIFKDNSAALETSEKQAHDKGIQEDFHLMGTTGYASLFYNFDASTLEAHTEMDWLMTTIYVPPQNWTGKDHNHLQFLFHLNNNENGLIKIPMKPGTIIFSMDICSHIIKCTMEEN